MDSHALAHARLDKLGRHLQELEILRLLKHISLHVSEQRSQISLWQSLDHLLLLVEIEGLLPVAELAYDILFFDVLLVQQLYVT
jgi:hypothetical protein